MGNRVPEVHLWQCQWQRSLIATNTIQEAMQICWDLRPSERYPTLLGENEMDEKSKSLARSKKSSVKLSDILIGAGITTFTGPGGGLAYGVLKLLVEHAHSFIKDRNNDRLNQFHETLIRGDLDRDEVKEFLEKDIDLEEYYILLRAAIQDDEDQKTYYYGELLRKLALGQVPKEYKLYLMKIVRELTSFEIELIRKIYVYKKYDLIPDQGPSEQLSTLLDSKNLAMKLAIDNFLRLGLLERESEKLKPTDVILSTAKIFFKMNDLTPTSIGRKVWRQGYALIIAPQEAEYSAITLIIQQLLRDNRLKSAPILLFHPELLQTVSLVNVSIIILVIGRTKHSGFPILGEINALAKTVEIPPSVKVIKVIVKTGDLPFDDFLPSIQADGVVNCSLDDVTALQPLNELLKDFAGSE